MESDWSLPINLSNSGSVDDPAVVVDSDGVTHVVWYDQFDGYKYVESSDTVVWSQPLSVSFPFQDYRPHLIADSNNFIYAFWQDDQGSLYSSRVLNSDFGDVDSWDVPRMLAEAALTFDVALGEDGTLHLAYLRPLNTPDAPAGVYYRQITDRGTWSSTQPIQTSLYLRGMTTTDGHLRIASGSIAGENTVYITWDERPLRRVHMIRSVDGGNTWDDPLEVDQPNADTGFTTPFDLSVTEWNDSLMLLWKTGEPLSSCTHHYQVSVDAGETWGESAQVFGDNLGCSTQDRFLAKRADMLVWQANINGQMTWLAWDGNNWSEPQVQTDLSSVENPLTYEYIALGCLNLADLPGGNQILATGCEQDQNGDIWFTSRSLGSYSDWFSSPSDWSKPEELFDISPEMQSLDLLVDPNGKFHAFWTQPTDSDAPNGGTSIFYSQYDGDSWTQPVAILTSPDGEAANPSIVIDPTGRLFVAWSSGQIGDLNISSASAERAFSPSEWTQPVILPAPSSSVSSPDLIVDASGTVVIAYAIPLNEFRGIYFVTSTDQGATWSAPEQILDAVAAGWDMVDSPHVLVNPSGEMSLLWQRQPFPGDAGPQTLYYSRNEGDAAQSDFAGIAQGWTNPEQVDDGQIVWSRLVSTPEGGLYRVWFNVSGENNTVYQQFSSDQGVSWNVSSILGNLGETVNSIDLSKDPSGNIQIFQVVTSNSQQEMLRFWKSADNQMTLQEERPLTFAASDRAITRLAASANRSGRLQILLGMLETGRTSQVRAYLASTFRIFEQEIVETGTGIATPLLSGGTITPEPATPTIESIGLEATSTPTLEPTPMSLVAGIPTSQGSSSNNLVTVVLISVALSGLILLFVLLIYLQRKRPGYGKNRK